MTKTFKIRGDYITLGQLLKACDIVQSGAHVKEFLAVEAVLVNDERDDRRGRKLRDGDTVRCPGNIIIKVEAEDR